MNDASGLVLFRFAIVATGGFSVAKASVTFTALTLGGVAFGWTVGRIGLALMERLGNSELAILVTFLLPTAAYAGGERLHVSGVLAVVTLGIHVGRNQHSAVPAATRIRAQALWGSLVYLLDKPLLASVAAVVGATVIARLVWTYSMWAGRSAARALGARNVDRPSFARASVIGWAGMRGVVTLAAALSIPETLPGRDFVLVSAFAVIMFTVLIQGTTLGALIRLLRLSGKSEVADRDRSRRRRGLR